MSVYQDTTKREKNTTQSERRYSLTHTEKRLLPRKYKELLPINQKT